MIVIWLLVLLTLVSVAGEIVGLTPGSRWLGMVLLPPLIGAVVWHLEGRPRAPTWTWVGLLFAWLLGSWLLIPYPLDGAAYAIGYAFLMALLFSERASSAWLRLWQGSANTEYLPGVYDLRPRRHDRCRAMFAACESFGEPLWDIPWEIAGKAGSDATSTARRLARRILAREWVVMIETYASGPERELTREEAFAVLGRAEPWTDPGIMFSLVATDSGQDAYWKHVARRPDHRVGFN